MNNNAHNLDEHANRFGRQTWREAEVGKRGYTSCSYCGSICPLELAIAIKQGASLEPADRKYGWPHKFYIASTSQAINHRKFYTVHLEDATESDRATIEEAMGVNIRFNDDGTVQWRPFTNG